MVIQVAIYIQLQKKELAPITRSHLAANHESSTTFCLEFAGPKESINSPKTKENKGNDNPFKTAKNAPIIINALSFLEAYLNNEKKGTYKDFSSFFASLLVLFLSAPLSVAVIILTSF